jgi:hypothetical protein
MNGQNESSVAMGQITLGDIGLHKKKLDGLTSAEGAALEIRRAIAVQRLANDKTLDVFYVALA